MTDLVHAHSFTTLPSERMPPLTPVQVLIRKLADQAMALGPNGFGSRSDQARRFRDRYRHPFGWAERHPNSPLPFELQPGAFLQTYCKRWERSLLVALTSDDVANYQLEVPYSMVADWPCESDLPQPNRLMWTRVGGMNPDRNELGIGNQRKKNGADKQDTTTT